MALLCIRSFLRLFSLSTYLFSFPLPWEQLTYISLDILYFTFIKTYKFIYCNMTWRDTITDFSANIFSDLITKPITYDIGKYEPLPCMPLQMFLFFNVFFFPFWITTSLVFLYLKFDCFEHLTQFLSVTVFIMLVFIEIVRLYLGYLGNLSEKIPELAGFWMLSILLQFPLYTFLLVNPYLQQRPIELTLNLIMWLLLQAELLFGFYAIRKAAARAKQYYVLKSHLRTSHQQENPRQKVE